MLRKILILSFLMGFFITNVQAAGEETLYMGIQAAQVTYEDNLIEAKPPALVLRFGGYVDEVAIEARVGLGLQGYGDTVNYLGIDYEFNVESLLGLYGLYSVGWGSNASFYGIMGVTTGELSVSAPGVTSDDSDTNLSYGVGFNLAGFNAEFMHYFHDTDYDVTAISFGYVSQF
jgi:hypothetical protein